MLFDFNEEMSVKELTEKLLQDSEEFINQTFKASGVSIMDAMGDLDATQGAAIGGCMKLYKTAKKLSIKYAEIADQMLEEIGKLEKMNEELRKQNDRQIELLQELRRELSKK